MNAWRRRRTAHEVTMIVMNGLTHRAKVMGRTTAMVVLRTTVIITTIVTAIITMVVVLALLRAAVVVIVALIGAGVQQRGRTEHQYAQAGNQTFRHFHRGFPHCTYSKKGFRTMF
jgi:hypothetical protein